MTGAAALAVALPAYEIGGELGRGGFGIVVAGRHRQLGRLVAIKELPPQLAADEGVRARFVTEARVLASLDHPHIVPIYDYVEQDGLCLLVMESLPGGTVWEAFQATGYTAPMACAVVMVACAGLHYAHQHGVLHRDVKPENLLFTQSGQLKVTDFGIAKVVGGKDALATSAGEILGTPAYMAPEQAEGRDLGPHSDVYAAGVMLYELLAGVLPYSEEGGGIAIVYRHVYEQPIPLRDVAPQVPEGVAAVVMRALSKDPADRYASAEDFGVAIGEAATAAFGVGWLAGTQVPVMGGGRILSSTERVNSLPQPEPRGARETFVASAARPLDASAAPPDATLAGDAPTPPAAVLPPPPGAVLPPPPGAAGVPPSAVAAAPRTRAGAQVPQQRVRPSTVLRPQGFIDVSPDALVPVREVLQVPKRPVPFVLLTLALLGLTAALAVLGVSDSGTTVARQGITLAGTDLSSNQAIQVDLSRTVPVTVSLPARADRRPDAVTLSLAVAGVDVATSSRAPLTRGAAATAGAALDLRGSRFLVTGPVEGTLHFTRKGEEVLAAPARLELDRPPYLTVVGVAAMLALLFLLAYGESLLSPLRKRGRRRLMSYGGLLVVGAGLGGLAVVASWLLGVRPPTVPTLALCAGLGALAGLALATATVQSGRRARVLRVARREGLHAR